MFQLDTEEQELSNSYDRGEFSRLKEEKQFTKVSLKVRENNMQVNAEFSQIENDITK